MLLLRISRRISWRSAVDTNDNKTKSSSTPTSGSIWGMQAWMTSGRLQQIPTAIASDTVRSRCWVAVGTGHGQVEIQARLLSARRMHMASQGQVSCELPCGRWRAGVYWRQNTLPGRISTPTRPAGLSSATSSSILSRSQRSHAVRKRYNDTGKMCSHRTLPHMRLRDG